MSELKAPHWFGIGLAAGLIFLWCIVSSIETGLHGGWIWGMILTGIVLIFAFVMALIRFWGSDAPGGDRLTREKRNPVMQAKALRLEGVGAVPRSNGCLLYTSPSPRDS